MQFFEDFPKLEWGMFGPLTLSFTSLCNRPGGMHEALRIVIQCFCFECVPTNLGLTADAQRILLAANLPVANTYIRI